MASGNSQPSIAPPEPAAEAARPTDWYHVLDAEGHAIPDPVFGFYTRSLVNFPCKWSTDQGNERKRTIGHPLPPRQFYQWGDHKLHERAAYFREKYPQDMATLTRPMRWEDLFEYFDGRDLYFQGAWNCWNLLNVLYDENILLAPELLDALRAETDLWVKGWAGLVPNRRRLMAWNRAVDVLTVLWQRDWTEGGISELDEPKLGMLRVSLVNYYRLVSTYNRMNPSSETRSVSQGGNPIPVWHDLPQSPPDRITPPLISIPEEGHAHVSAALSDGGHRKVPRHKFPLIVNGSKAIFPRLKRSDPTSPLANKGKNADKNRDTLRAVTDPASMHTSSSDSGETWKSDQYFTAEPSSKKEDAHKMHKSAKSTSALKSGPFPKLVNPLRGYGNSILDFGSADDQEVNGGNTINKATPLVASSTQLPQTVVGGQQASGQNHISYYVSGTQPSQVQTLQRYPSQGPTVYQPSFYCGQAVQAPVPSGSTYMMQSGQVQNSAPRNSMATSGVQHVQAQGVHPYVTQAAQGGHAQSGTRAMYPQMGAGIPRHMVSMPAQSYSQVGFTQSNYGYQNQDRRLSNSTRSSRTSPPQNGWQTKIRDEPLHGPVYVHNRLHSNSNASAAGRQDIQPFQQQGGRQDLNARPICVNQQVAARPGACYEPCHCVKCLIATRSIFLRGFKQGVLPSEETRGGLRRFFEKFGQVEDVRVRQSDHGPVNAHVRFSHHTQAFATIAAIQGPGHIDIPDLGSQIHVSFANYSMYANRDRQTQKLLMSSSEADMATPRASSSQGNPSQQMVRREAQPNRNGLAAGPFESRQPPFPGYGQPGGTVVHHPLPTRPPIFQLNTSRNQPQGVGFGMQSSGQVPTPSQFAALQMAHRPTPASLQREIDSLDQGKEGRVRKPQSVEATSEPMDLETTPSTSPSTVVGNRRPINLPRTPPDQRDSSSSSNEQGEEPERPLASPPEQAVPGHDHKFLTLEEVDRETFARRVNSIGDLPSSASASLGGTLPSHQEQASSAASNPTQALPPTLLTNDSDESGHAKPSTSTARRTPGKKRDVPPVNSDPETRITDKEPESSRDMAVPPVSPAPPQDKKVKYKKNKAKKKQKATDSAASGNVQPEQDDAPRPPSSSSLASSTTTEGQRKPNLRKNQKKKKATQLSESTTAIDAAQPAPEGAVEKVEAKTEEYKDKIKSLFSPPEKSNNTAPSTSFKKPEPAAENMRKGYRANAGGSLKMQKNRPPALAHNTFKPPENSESAQLPSIAETATAPTVSPAELEETSPTELAFTDQKFEIDQMKSKEQCIKQTKAVSTQPKNKVRIGSFPPGFDPYPRPGPTRPPSRDDVFSPKKNENLENETEKKWMHTESVRKTKPADNKDVVTPSPSPRKATVVTPSSTQSNLNPSAKPFIAPESESASRSLTPTATMLTTSSKHGRQSSHISTHSSAPSTSSLVSSDRRYFTPLEQTPRRIPTPPSPKKGKPGQRRGPGPQKESNTNTDNSNGGGNRKKNTGRPKQTKEQAKKKPVEPLAPKMSVDNFPELPMAKKPIVEAKAPKLSFPSSGWQKKSPTSSQASSSSQASPQSEKKDASPKNDQEKGSSERTENGVKKTSAEWLLEKHRKETMSCSGI